MYLLCNRSEFYKEDDPVGDVYDMKAAWTELCKKYMWQLEELECKA